MAIHPYEIWGMSRKFPKTLEYFLQLAGLKHEIDEKSKFTKSFDPTMRFFQVHFFGFSPLRGLRVSKIVQRSVSPEVKFIPIHRLRISGSKLLLVVGVLTPKKRTKVHTTNPNLDLLRIGIKPLQKA
jgi:hypothetical protein